MEKSKIPTTRVYSTGTTVTIEGIEFTLIKYQPHRIIIRSGKIDNSLKSDLCSKFTQRKSYALLDKIYKVDSMFARNDIKLTLYVDDTPGAQPSPLLPSGPEPAGEISKPDPYISLH